MPFYHVVGAVETLIVTNHEVLTDEPWEMPIQTEASPGVEGVGHLVDKRKSRQLSLRAWAQGYETIDAVYDALETIDNLQGDDVTVRWKQGATTQHDWTNCTFVGFERQAPNWDPESGWMVFGTFRWIQRQP